MARETVESMREAALSMDPQGKINTINPAAEQLLDVSAGTILGQSFAHAFLDREELERCNDCVLQAIYDPTKPRT